MKPRPGRIGGTLWSAAIAALPLILGSGAPQASWIEPRTGMRFVRIPAGSFVMGSPVTELGHSGAETAHTVRLSRDFFLGQFEVTQAQWQAVMGSNPSHFASCEPTCPVESVTWREAVAFIEKLRTLTGDSGFRLPTEAEWEYACRAGTRGAFSTGAAITTDQANFDGRYPYAGGAKGLDRAKPVPVGTFAANAWGLHDMHGNVWEWCADEFCPYSGDVTDPVGRCGSEFKVIRGGSWYFDADSMRSALRYTHRPGEEGFSVGLRVARQAPAP